MFHVGAAKTASTFIQSSLSANYSKLLQHRVFYPLNSYGKHPELAFSASFDLFDTLSTYLHYLPKSLNQDSDLKAFFLARTRDYFGSFLASSCHTLVLSDELLPYYCNSIEKLENLRMLFPLDVNLHFVYYTRSPADMYISLYSSLVKVNQTQLWPHQFFLPQSLLDYSAWITSPEMFDHHAFITNTKTVFGDDSISVFDFDVLTHPLSPQSPVDHFFSFLGLQASAFVFEDRKVNPRLDYLSLFLLCLFNRSLVSLSGFPRLHSVLVWLKKSFLLPPLEFFSSFGFYRFPTRRVLLSRQSFNRLFRW